VPIPYGCTGKPVESENRHDLSYKHPSWLRKLDATDAMQKAINQAYYLMEELSICWSKPRNYALAVKKTELGPPRWLADTGSGWDLVSKADCHPSVKPFKSDEIVGLSTANGDIEVGKKVQLQVSKIRENVEPLLLSNTPPVLSVGRRCMLLGYSFIWPKGKAPYFICPGGKKITLEVENFTPWLVEREGGIASPVVAGARPALEAEQPDVVIAIEDAPAEEGEPPPTISKAERLKTEAMSLLHQMTHFPKNPYCRACLRCKIQQVQTPDRSKEIHREAKPTKFGEAVTADHFIAKDEDLSPDGYGPPAV
jgi:hypothetical protein